MTHYSYHAGGKKGFPMHRCTEGLRFQRRQITNYQLLSVLRPLLPVLLLVPPLLLPLARFGESFSWLLSALGDADVLLPAPTPGPSSAVCLWLSDAALLGGPSAPMVGDNTVPEPVPVLPVHSTPSSEEPPPVERLLLDSLRRWCSASSSSSSSSSSIIMSCSSPLSSPASSFSSPPRRTPFPVGDTLVGRDREVGGDGPGEVLVPPPAACTTTTTVEWVEVLSDGVLLMASLPLPPPLEGLLPGGHSADGVVALGVTTVLLFVAVIVVGDAGTLVALDGGGGGDGADEEEEEDSVFRWCDCCVEGDSGTGVTEICARTSSDRPADNNDDASGSGR